MKPRNLIICLLLAGVVGLSVNAQAQTRRFNAKPGLLKVRIEGTSNIHDWQVEGKIIGGFMEVGPNFPTKPGQEIKPGKVDAKVQAFVPVRSLISVEKDGKPYNTKMDDIMYDKFLAQQFPRLIYTLNELVLKEAPKAKDQPYLMDATGELAVAGVTNKLSMPVNVTPQADGMIKITGTAPLKMTSFKIEPPAPAIAGGLIKTGDDIKILFEWVVAEKK